MNLPFKTLTTQGGIPVYFQNLPADVNPVAARLVMWVGAADDVAVGAPGLHHWFEHVPFRGTTAFPKGSEQTMGHFARHGGYTNAYTSQNRTCYIASTPNKMWKEAIEMVVELAGQPLLRAEDIQAERTIIREEIKGTLSSVERKAWYQIPALLAPGHAYGHHTLGTEESLDSMTVETLQQAHKTSYDASRAAFFISGNIEESELMVVVEELSLRLPKNGLSVRTGTPTYGALPQWSLGTHTKIDTEFDSSYMLMMWQLPARAHSKEERLKYSMLRRLLTSGSLSSPLLRTVREERQLVYSCGTMFDTTPDGGEFILYANARAANMKAIEQAFADTLALTELRSTERLAFVRDALAGQRDMQLPDPDDMLSHAIESVATTGEALQHADSCNALLGLSDELVMTLPDLLPLSAATILTFEGK
jgi:predicted Zn-dependent peptidase